MFNSRNSGPGAPVSSRVSEKKKKLILRKRIFLIAGLVCIAAALVFITLALVGIFGMEAETADMLRQAEELIADDFNEEAQLLVDEMSAPQESGKESANPSASPETSGLLPGAVNRKPIGQPIGVIEFTTLDNRRVPIIEGAKPRQLAKGAGHHQDKAYPGEKDNCLIFGHRNTVFRGFGKLKEGDPIVIETEYGKFTYRIAHMQVVEPLDPLMFESYEEPVLTLVTCYPFDYVGSAPKRYVVVCKLDTSALPSQGAK